MTRMADRLIERCEDELRKRFTEMRHNGSSVSLDSLKKDLDDRKRRQAKLIEAIETAGDVSMLTGRLRDLQSEVKCIQEAIANFRTVKLEVVLGEIREHVIRAVEGLKRSLDVNVGTNDLVRAKAALAKHVGKLVLTPGTRDGCPVYKVSGAISIPDSEKCRMQLVARDGIEPPTPAFSGLRSTS